MFQIPIGLEGGTAVECGYLTVPAHHNNPTGPSIELAVAIIKSPSPDRQSDPLFLAQGGPGGSTIDTYAELLLTPDNGLLTNRDIVLFDQRGTLNSNPSLYCTEIDEYNVDKLDENLSHEENQRRYYDALEACRERLVAQGIDLSAFDSLENAADINALRSALGYEKINLYGVSYGTLLALHYLRMYPDSLRSVILDGVLPPQSNFILNVAQTQNQAFTRLFEACSNDQECSQHYPNLEQVFFDVVNRLNNEPAHASMTDLKTGATYPEVIINGETFLLGAFQMMYSSDLVEALPRMIYDAKNGNFDAFSRILALFVLDRSISYGMYFSVLCAEDSDFTPEEQDLSGVRPEVAQYESSSPEEFLAACKMWDVDILDAGVDAPVQSDIPTLLLSGGFDPITPDVYAKETAASLSNGYSIFVKTGGHGQALDGDCQNRIILDFLNNPSTSPDTTCLQGLQKPAFYTPESVVDLPVLIDLLNLKPLPTAVFLLIALACLFMWTGALIFPTSWIIERTRRRPVPAFTNSGLEGTDLTSLSPTANKPGVPERYASWLTVLAAIVLSIFLAFILVASFKMAIDNDSRLFFGMPGETRPWWMLPWIFLIITLILVWSAFRLWLRRQSPLWRRIYISLLALTAFSVLFFFVYLGFFSALF